MASPDLDLADPEEQRALSERAYTVLHRLKGYRRSFVLAYATAGSPTAGKLTESALAAGYGERNAMRSAQDAMNTPDVREAILLVERETEKLLARHAPVDAAWLLRELVTTYRVTPLDIWDWSDPEKPVLRLHELSEEQARAIESVEIDQLGDGSVTRVKVKLVAKGAQLDRIGKHRAVKAFVTSHEHEHKVGKTLREELAAARDARALREGPAPALPASQPADPVADAIDVTPEPIDVEQPEPQPAATGPRGSVKLRELLAKRRGGGGGIGAGPSRAGEPSPPPSADRTLGGESSHESGGDLEKILRDSQEAETDDTEGG